MGEVITNSQMQAALRKRQKAPVRCFVPRGRSSAVLYIVALKEHSGVVKVGRTTRWKNRRVFYDTWNLTPSGAIAAERVITITEDYVDLPALEAALLNWLEFPMKHGREWFIAEFEDVSRAVDEFLNETGLSYDG